MSPRKFRVYEILTLIKCKSHTVQLLVHSSKDLCPVLITFLPQTWVLDFVNKEEMQNLYQFQFAFPGCSQFFLLAVFPLGLQYWAYFIVPDWL